MSLENLNGDLIDERILRALREMGFEQFTPIQEQAIPQMMDGIDLIGQAQTGTGKTAAFGIPLLQQMDPENEALQGLVLCPTRELAIQAADEIRKFAKFMHGVRVLPVYGGQDIMRQIRSLKGGVQIVVGTPGRVMDHMNRHTIKLDEVKTVVLDEADEMLTMGFREDMETILSEIEGEHQTVLFSATMPQAILDITNQFQKDPVLIRTIQKELTVPSIRQYYYEVRKEFKKESVARLLDYYNPARTLIFCNTKRMVEELAEDLKGRGYFAEGLHGDLSQAVRDRVMGSFRSGTCDVLIATDVAARGLDIEDVEAVINYDVPQEIEYYVHRIGRTGRAGRNGRSFTLVCGREIYRIREIEKVCKTKMTARALPTSVDINQKKAGTAIAAAKEVMKNQDLSEMTRIITDLMEAEDFTALELAAAFLRVQLGEDKEDIPMENFEEDMRRKRKERDRERNRERNREVGRERGHRFDRRDRDDSFREGRRFKKFEDGDFKKRPFEDKKTDRKSDKKFEDKFDKKPDKKFDKGRKPFDEKTEKKPKHADAGEKFSMIKKKKDKSDFKAKEHKGKDKDIRGKVLKKGRPKKLDRHGNPIY